MRFVDATFRFLSCFCVFSAFPFLFSLVDGGSGYLDHNYRQSLKLIVTLRFLQAPPTVENLQSCIKGKPLPKKSTTTMQQEWPNLFWVRIQAHQS